MAKRITPRAQYTLEFKEEAVRLVESGMGMAEVARRVNMSDQTLFNWCKAKKAGQLKAVDVKAVSPEQMEISRLKAELALVKMERDILEKATAYFAKAKS